MPQTLLKLKNIALCDRHDQQTIADRIDLLLEYKAQLTTPRRIYTPQRRANYNDKGRFRRADLKQIAFRKYKCNSSSQIKSYLKVLKIKLDLRLTAAWVAIVYELGQEILAAKAILDSLGLQPGTKNCDRKVQVLLSAMDEALTSQNWNSVKAQLVTHADYKTQALAMLTRTQKQQLTTLVL